MFAAAPDPGFAGIPIGATPAAAKAAGFVDCGRRGGAMVCAQRPPFKIKAGAMKAQEVLVAFDEGAAKVTNIRVVVDTLKNTKCKRDPKFGIYQQDCLYDPRQEWSKVLGPPLSAVAAITHRPLAIWTDCVDLRFEMLRGGDLSITRSTSVRRDCEAAQRHDAAAATKKSKDQAFIDQMKR